MLREMFPGHFNKSDKKEKTKAPKEPKKPREPYPPNKPEKYIINQTNKLSVDICSSKYVSIYFDKIMEARSQITESDDKVELCIDASLSHDNYYDSSCSCSGEVSEVYFQWHETVEDPKYQKNLEKYQESLEKYNQAKLDYDSKVSKYQKDMKAYNKELKSRKLEQMKAEKARLEALIAKAEKKDAAT
jgi:hypothetical protein